MKISYSFKELWEKVSYDDFFYSVFIIFLCIVKMFYKLITGTINLLIRLYNKVFSDNEVLNKKI